VIYRTVVSPANAHGKISRISTFGVESRSLHYNIAGKISLLHIWEEYNSLVDTVVLMKLNGGGGIYVDCLPMSPVPPPLILSHRRR